MNCYLKVYEENKKLDALFAEKFRKDTKDILLKNMIELIVELAELANEVKSFKYWSRQKCSKKKILDEFIDSLMMGMFFANTLDMTLEELVIEPIEHNVNKQFLYLFQLAANLPNNYEVETVSEIMVNLMHLAELLNLTEEEICEAAFKKMKITTKKIMDM